MKKLITLGLFLALASGAFAYLYDGLNTNDSVNVTGVPDALHARGGFYYLGLLNKHFDAEGESQDDFAEGVDVSYYGMAIPIDVGYNFNGVAQLDIGLQLIKWNFDSGIEGAETQGEFGIGDLWIKAKGIFQVGPEWYCGPRIGFKAAVGDNEKTLGDGQHDIDFGAFIGKTREGNNFRGKANLGLRYRLEAEEYTIPGTSIVAENYTPGMVIYARIEPGFAITPEFEAYGIIDFATAFKSKADGEDIEDSESMGLSIGVRPTYFVDANNAISAEFQYPVMGDNIDQEIIFGVNYDAYIPF